jgi:hypothetical protein
MPPHRERPAPDGTPRLCYRLAMKKRAPFYPCLGYCIIDATGTCVACGRPPDLGAPKGSALAAPAEPLPATAPPEPRSPKKPG